MSVLSRIDGYKCDACGKIMNVADVKGWIRLDFRPRHREDYVTGEPPNAYHACGRGCAHDLIDGSMEDK